MARIYKCTIMATHSDGTLIQPSVHYQTDVADIGSEPNPDDVARRCWEHFATSFLLVTPTTVTVHELVVTEQVVKPNIGVVGAFTVEQSGTSTAGTNHLPHELVPLVNLHTQTHSRSARGWLFLASPSDVAWLNANGEWQQTLVTNIQGLANLFATSFGVGDINVTTTKPVIYSRTRHQRGNTPYVFPVSHATANPQPAWLRSRGTAP